LARERLNAPSEAMDPFISFPAHLPVAPRPLAGELLSSWLGRLAAANALDFGELLELLRVRLALPRAGEFYAGGLDYACSGPVLKALSSLSRLSTSRIAALSLKRRFGPLGWFWLSHDPYPFYNAQYRQRLRPQLLPSYCAECLREQTRRGQPAHLRAEWALAFLTHCPRHRVGLWSCCPDCRDMASMGWGLGRGQPPTRGLPALRPAALDRVFGGAAAFVEAPRAGAGVGGRPVGGRRWGGERSTRSRSGLGRGGEAGGLCAPGE
jgi:hypothetical protein